MSATSQIIVRLQDGSYRGVYCHFDGYPSDVGKVLLEHYNSQELAELVTSMGAMSSLAASMEYPVGHSYSNPTEGYSVLYHRDRGDQFTVAESPTLQGCVDAQPYGETQFYYVWQGFWGVTKHPALGLRRMHHLML